MRRLILSCCFLIAGCAEPMSNDEIIAETNKCEEAGLRAWAHKRILYPFQTIQIECMPQRGD